MNPTNGAPPPHLAELTEVQKQKLNAARRYCQEQSVRHVMEQQELQTKQFMQGLFFLLFYSSSLNFLNTHSVK